MDDLTKTEQKDLARLEGLIQEGLGTFCAVGRALHAIREGRLYRASHETFEAYCADKWEFSRQRAYQLLAAAEEVGRLSTIVDTPPQRETHVRPLLAVPVDHRADVWRETLGSAPRDLEGRPIVAARLVQAAVDRWHDGRKVGLGNRDESTEPPAIGGAGPEAESTRDTEGEDLRPAARRCGPLPELVATIAEVRASDRNQYVDEIPAAADDTEVCPECGSTDLAEDSDGTYCARCKATIEDGGQPTETFQPAPDDELLRSIDQLVRRQFAGRLEVAAARMEALVDRWRAEA